MAVKEYQGTPNRPGLRGYVTKVFSGKDIRKARGILDKQAKESAAKIAEEKVSSWRTRVRNFTGRVWHVTDRSAQQITAMQRGNKQLYPKGPPASRPTFNMGGYIKTMPDGTKVVVRDGEE